MNKLHTLSNGYELLINFERVLRTELQIIRNAQIPDPSIPSLALARAAAYSSSECVFTRRDFTI